jgi:hypothetical protein
MGQQRTERFFQRVLRDLPSQRMQKEREAKKTKQNKNKNETNKQERTGDEDEQHSETEMDHQEHPPPTQQPQLFIPKPAATQLRIADSRSMVSTAHRSYSMTRAAIASANTTRPKICRRNVTSTPEKKKKKKKKKKDYTNTRTGVKHNRNHQVSTRTVTKLEEEEETATERKGEIYANEPTQRRDREKTDRGRHTGHASVNSAKENKRQTSITRRACSTNGIATLQEESYEPIPRHIGRVRTSSWQQLLFRVLPKVQENATEREVAPHQTQHAGVTYATLATRLR